jgi:hypothetical protein
MVRDLLDEVELTLAERKADRMTVRRPRTRTFAEPAAVAA